MLLRLARNVFLRQPSRVWLHPAAVRAETQFAPQQCWLKLILITYGAARLFVVTRSYTATVARAPGNQTAKNLRSRPSSLRPRGSLPQPRTPLRQALLLTAFRDFGVPPPPRSSATVRPAPSRTGDIHPLATNFRGVYQIVSESFRQTSPDAAAFQPPAGRKKSARPVNRSPTPLKDCRKPAIPRVKEYAFE